MSKLRWNLISVEEGKEDEENKIVEEEEEEDKMWRRQH